MRKINIILILLFISGIAYGQVRLPKLISDGMVLQRDANVKIWGWASENEKITVNFKGIAYNTIANNTGEWEIKLPKMKAGGPFIMAIKAKNEVIVKDILIGDVWICSGQSNMELNMSRVSPLYESEIANSENKQIRYFAVPQKYNFIEPQKDLQSGEWRSANPESVLKFSAAAYFFAKEIYEKYHIPIGLINASLGGSPAEAWISEEKLKGFPEYYNELKRFKDSNLISKIENDDRARINKWYRELKEKDEGYKDPKRTWFNPEFNSPNWGTMKVPGYWVYSPLNTVVGKTYYGWVHGSVWFRKEVDIPPEMTGKKAKIILGRIIDADSVYINNVFVGSTSYQYPPRRYDIPPNLLKAGKNTIVIRIVCENGAGGFVEDKPYEIVVGDKKIDLKGEWQNLLGASMDTLASQTFIRWKPAGLYNAMIAPLTKFRIKGAIWYQGEANAARYAEYTNLFSTLISNWRSVWGQGDFPFLFVQLPNFMETKKEPSESNWASMREAQLKTLKEPNTGMVVAIDIGEWNDLHPLNKKDIGRRFALAAQKIAYGDRKVVYSGPLFESMKIEGNKIILTFKNIGGGLIIKNGGELKHFAIAGKDKKYVWAKAIIENNKVIVWNENISEPVSVRYAWADNPEDANLYNKEGLPASPFRAGE